MRNVLKPQGSEQTAKEGGGGLEERQREEIRGPKSQETGQGAGLPTVLSGLCSLIASDSQNHHLTHRGHLSSNDLRASPV